MTPVAPTFVSAKGLGLVPVGSLGSAKITHDGVLGAIKANTTTVNATGIGLTHSFNVACSARDSSPISGLE